MTPPIQLSIVVPTHNRAELLATALRALGRQTFPMSSVEVIVVADDCRDDTAARVQGLIPTVPYRLRLVGHSARSAAASRNLGASSASGQILLFLDDDVVAQPGLVAAHMRRQHADDVVLGYSRPVLPERASWFQQDARRWWEDAFRLMATPGHRFTYRDFFSGNVSLSAALFSRTGGFDVGFAGRLEDYELGVRLLQDGARFRYEPAALGLHHDRTTLATWLRRLRHDGGAHVLIGQRHPALMAPLLGGWSRPPRKWRRLVRMAVLRWPGHGDRLEQPLVRLANVCEALRLRGRWQQIINVLREYNYWRGVAETAGSTRALRQMLRQSPPLPAVSDDAPAIDLLRLPPADELATLLDQGTTSGVRVLIDGYVALALAPEPGSEPLRIEHLRHAVDDAAGKDFVPALALHRARRLAGAAQ